MQIFMSRSTILVVVGVMTVSVMSLIVGRWKISGRIDSLKVRVVRVKTMVHVVVPRSLLKDGIIDITMAKSSS